MFQQRLSRNEQYILESQKVYLENLEKVESGIDSRNLTIGWGESLGSYLPERCAITIIICNGDDPTQSQT